MSFLRMFKTSLPRALLTLLLLLTGVAWGVAEVESRYQESSPEQKSSLDLLKKMEFLQQEVQELRGKVEEQNYQLQQLQAHQKKLYLDLDRRLREGGPSKVGAVSGISLEEHQDLTASNMQGGIDARLSSQLHTNDTASSSTTLVSGLVTDEELAVEEKAYQTAYHQIQNKDYESALMGFKSLISGFPNGKYAPNAHYWLGEIYLVKGNFDLAAESFNVVYQKYPQHPKAADSLLKLGYVEYSKGQWKRSAELLSQVKSQFPGTTSAQLADSRLQKMHHDGNI